MWFSIRCRISGAGPVLSGRSCSRSETPLECSVCVHVAALGMPIVIQDARLDKRWRNLVVSHLQQNKLEVTPSWLMRKLWILVADIVRE